MPVPWGYTLAKYPALHSPPLHTPSAQRQQVLHTTERVYLGIGSPPGRGALEGEGPQRWPQRRLGRRLEEVAKAVGGGYCRLQMPLRLALGVRGTVAGHRLGALEGGRGVPPPLPMHPWVQGVVSQISHRRW